ncbi:MAG: methyl-accepting chemotaxis protein [Spirochaetales bacterium]|nr:methyl-accepting chemotaxis protein [Spirochaetales bacterium]
MRKFRTRILFFMFVAILPAVLAFQALSAWSSWRSLREASIYYFQRLASERAAELSHELSSAASTAVQIADTLMKARDAGLAERNFPPAIFRSALERDDYFYAAWALFLPDAWDGGDADFVGAEGYDETGGFSPWLYRDESGGIAEELLYWGEDYYEEDYFREAIRALRPVVLEPYLDDDYAGTLMTTISVPLIDPYGTAYGVFGLDIDLATLSEQVGAGEGADVAASWSALVSPEGMILGHTDPALVAKPFDEVESEGAAVLLEAADALSAATAGDGAWNTETKVAEPIAFDSILSGQPSYGAVATVDIGGIATWRLVTSVPVALAEKAANEAAIGMATTALALVLLLLGATLFTARAVTRPVTSVAMAFARMADGDFSGRLDSRRQDEIGALIAGFNEVGASVSEIVRSVRGSVAELETGARDLAQATSATEKTISRIATTTTRLHELAEAQDERLRGSAEAVIGISGDADGLTALVAEQSKALERSRSSIDAFSERLTSSGAMIAGMDEAFGELRKSSETGSATISGVRELSEDVLRKSGSLGEASEVIASIASQTNLLAMNAAIEAAHAGDSGRGFAVVADEIRKLAESTAERSKEIQAILTEVNEAVEAMRERSGDADTSFAHVRALIDRVGTLESGIREAMVAESEEGRRLVVELERMDGLSTKVKEGANGIRLANREVSESVTGLGRSSAVLRQLSAAVDKETDGLRGIVVQLRAEADRTGELASGVKGATERFVIEAPTEDDEADFPSVATEQAGSEAEAEAGSAGEREA